MVRPFPVGLGVFRDGLRIRGSCLVALIAISACGKKPPDPSPTGDAGAVVTLAPQGKVLEAAENEAADGGARAKREQKWKAHEKVDVAGGKLVAGSTPGDKGRDPTLEPALLEVELGGFSIDKYLYPNEPGKPPVTGVSRSRAQELCEQAGARLCTELEWERACKGPEDKPYATGTTWDASCEKDPSACASGYGALGLGTLREWTASDVAPIENVQTKAAAARGAKSDASAVDHRCAHRAAVDANVTADDLGFRCCHGAPNAASVPSPAWQQTYRKAELSAQQVADMFATAPQLKDLKDITFFKEPDDANLVLSRGDAGAGVPNTAFTTMPLLWNPVPGEELLVVAGRAQKSSFIVAFYRLPGDRYRIASSLVLKDEKGPIALGYNGYVRRKLGWAIAWDGRGESGNVTYREDNRVVITQK